jgi:Fe-S-cluster containining protein
MTARDHCARCGECCRAGGPALHLEDLELLRSGVVSSSALITFRAGELALDQPSGGLLPLESEIVKIRGAGGAWTCIYFDAEDSGCGIYGNRPAECRALKCWDTSELEAMYASGRITRADILGPGAMGIVEEHERRCPAGRATELACAGGGMELDEMLRYDEAMRETLLARGAGEKELEFLLGRPLGKVVKQALSVSGA